MIGGITGVLMMPVFFFIHQVCMSIFPYVRDDAGGGGLVSRCDVMQVALLPLYPILWIVGSFSGFIHENFGYRQMFIVDALPWLVAYLIIILIFGLSFIAIRRIYLSIKPHKNGKNRK